MVPSNENTLYLIINQDVFDEILAGSKKQEFREISYTTFKRYLMTWEKGNDIGIYFDQDKISREDVEEYADNPMIYNNGVYPYLPIEYKFLSLAVGYNKEHDTMILEIEDIHFEPMQGQNGKDARFSEDGERMKIDDNGDLCIWQIVYTLGKIVKKNLKKK
ncbi:MAG: ASCH domain-containing protein [Candidatus Saccharimonadaceae bacterium]